MLVIFVSCSKSDDNSQSPNEILTSIFGNNIDIDNLDNYANQQTPTYITRDNTVGNNITDIKATLGRVLFYDKKLSIDNTISCASCHKQAFAFSDTALTSRGVEGAFTARHSMRLVNARFGVERKFFWDERAATLEQQTTMPIQDHAEMGFSGQSGRPALTDLMTKLSAQEYYNILFTRAFGDATITEARIQECLAQFVRSIQSFDTKYDAGRALVPNDGPPFPNFTAQENNGKQLFLQAPVLNAAGVRIGGGAGCNGCHNAPEFDINPNSGNNGVVAIVGGGGFDFNITRSPTLRDVVNRNGLPNGPFMHNGNFQSLRNVVLHYNTINIAPGNTNLDPRLRPNGNGQMLNLTQQEIDNIVAFLQTLSGSDVYTNPKWGDPFL
jgi:cytochrome c peroxidase